MVVKNRGLYLGLLVSLLGVGNVIQAYKLTVENRTSFRVTCVIGYYGRTFFSCRPDEEVVDPGRISRVIHSGGCSVAFVRASVGPSKIKAQSYIPAIGRAGNSTFVISEHGEGFRVTRDSYRSRFKN